MGEEWRPVVGYEGLYEVSSLGQVRSVDRIVTRSDGRQCRWKGRTLRVNDTAHGGFAVSLCCANGRQKTVKVHTLVAAAFLGPRPKKADVRHLDGNPSNNQASNLAYRGLGHPAR